MKKIIFMVLFSMILFGVYGQQRSENIWLIGTWTNTNTESFTNERNIVENWTYTQTLIFNDNGSGRWQRTAVQGRVREEENYDILFSIIPSGYPGTDIMIMIYILENNIIKESDRFYVYRINDQRFVNERDLIFNKRN